ncbi:repetitive proline-rich cell wall protein 1-like [Ischnura elegans]|uniref:repetitive proline-rich cell wall protein 1-like n=1 Tax=Ischnura elegans TaxID=197161 RepID=UPI001ED89465|nr:repetitive proline-rich cell wall protein 1-like [Ischnura elegans]
MKFQILICLATIALAQAVRDKRGYLDFHEPYYHAPFYHAPAYHAPVYHAPVYHAPVYHAPVIAKPAATSYAHYQSYVMSHPVARPVLAAGFAHPFPFGKYAGGFGYH